MTITIIVAYATFCVPSLNVLLFGDNTLNKRYNKLIFQAVQIVNVSCQNKEHLFLSLSLLCLLFSLETSALIINVIYAIILL